MCGLSGDHAGGFRSVIATVAHLFGCYNPEVSRLRVAAISFLNTVPLMYDFEHAPQREGLAERFDVHYTLPSLCAEELRAGTSDIGIVPVAAYTTIPDLWILPGVAIAAKHPVRSILLVSKRELREVRSVGTDTSSRTSVALLRLLFDRQFGLNPEFVSEEPELDRMMANHDAALLIGDPALRVNIADGKYRYVDLAEEWQRMTGLPFVFAFWALRGEAIELARVSDAVAVFQRSRDAGLLHAGELARKEAGRYGTTPELALEYLTQHIDYTLDEQNIAGLRLFFRYATECGALQPAPELRFL